MRRVVIVILIVAKDVYMLATVRTIAKEMFMEGR